MSHGSPKKYARLLNLLIFVIKCFLNFLFLIFTEILFIFICYLRSLETILDDIKSHWDETNPYLFVGTWRTLFGAHAEDGDLYSVNYLQYSNPKLRHI